MGQRVCPKCGRRDSLLMTSIDVDVTEIIGYIKTDKKGEVTYDLDYDFYPTIKSTVGTRVIFVCNNCSKLYEGDTIEQVANKEMVDAL